MNEDYENEELEEYEEEVPQSYSNYNLRPPRSNNIAVNAKNAVRKAGKETVKKVGTAFLNAAKQVFIALVSNPWVLLVVVIIILLAAFIWYVTSEMAMKNTTESVEDYISHSETIDPTAKALYEERHSLILLKLSEVNEMYDHFIKDTAISGDIRIPMKIKVGVNEVENKKATQYGGGAGVGVGGYNSNFTPGSDGIRDDERVKIITGASAPISSYMTGGRYVWSNGYLGGVKVDIVDVTVPIWDINGNSSTTVVQVNVKIKEIVEAIFKEIYEHPSKPAIISCGGFRANDGSPNHPFGVAIDINPDQNPFYVNGQLSVGVSYNPGSDPLSMGPDHPIVQIFNKYGWDWGGNWTEPKDYMHFSFMGG